MVVAGGVDADVVIPVVYVPDEHHVPACGALMEAVNREEQIERRMDALRNLITSHAKAKRDRVHLEQFRKVKIAVLMREAESSGFGSLGAQEREALANPEYIQLIEDLANATGTETETWWMLQLEQWKFDAWRTQMASERAEKSRYGAGG